MKSRVPEQPGKCLHIGNCAKRHLATAKEIAQFVDIGSEPLGKVSILDEDTMLAIGCNPSGRRETLRKSMWLNIEQTMMKRGGYARSMLRLCVFPKISRALLLLVLLSCGVSSQAQTLPVAVTVSMPSATPGERLVWSDEFNARNGQVGEPDQGAWTYETGGGGWGNGELETYCSPRTTAAPCDPAKQPNSFVGQDGHLHIVARRKADGQWTSARLVTHQLQSFQYGRIEARIRIPKGEGVWPAFWMLGEDIEQHPWPACGEIDIMENIGKEPTLVHGTLHGPGYQGRGPGQAVFLGFGQGLR